MAAELIQLSKTIEWSHLKSVLTMTAQHACSGKIGIELCMCAKAAFEALSLLLGEASLLPALADTLLGMMPICLAAHC